MLLKKKRKTTTKKARSVLRRVISTVAVCAMSIVSLAVTDAYAETYTQPPAGGVGYLGRFNNMPYSFTTKPANVPDTVSNGQMLEGGTVTVIARLGEMSHSAPDETRGHDYFTVRFDSGCMAGVTCTMYCNLYGAENYNPASGKSVTGTYVAEVLLGSDPADVTLGIEVKQIKINGVDVPMGTHDSRGWYKKGSGYQGLVCKGNWRQNLTGSVELTKTPAPADGTGTQKFLENPNYSLQGATFTLTKSDNSWSQRQTVGSDNKARWSNVPAGDYVLTETSYPSKGYSYQLAGSQNVSVLSGQTSTVTVGDIPQVFDIQINKVFDNPRLVAGNPNYSLEGAEYTVYSDPNCTSNSQKWTIVTDANGHGTSCQLPFGTYYVKETKPSKGTALDPNVYPVTVDSNPVGTLVTTVEVDSEEPVKYDPFSCMLYKKDSDEPNGTWQGDATLAGATYRFEFTPDGASSPTISFEADTTQVEGKNYARIRLMKNYVDIKNFSSTTGITLNDMWDSMGFMQFPIGTLKISEIKPPKGYKLEGAQTGMLGGEYINSPSITVKITDNHNDNSNILVSLNDTTTKEVVIRGGFDLTKADYYRYESQPTGDETLPQGDAEDLSATFNVINRSESAVVVNGTTYAPGAVCFTFKTNADGSYVSKNTLLPYGSYEIREAKGQTGYVTNTNWKGEFTIQNDKEIVHPAVSGNKGGNTTAGLCENVPIRGGVSGVKIDHDVNQAVPEGDATLEGAIFAIRNDSKRAVYTYCLDETGANPTWGWHEPGDVCYRVVTDASGNYKAPADALPYGTYHIYEEKASNGYLLNTEWSYDFSIRTAGEVKIAATNCDEQVIRGGVQIVKQDAELQASEAMKVMDADHKGLAGIKFNIINASVHAVKVNGEVIEPNQVTCQIVTYWDEDLGQYIAKTEADTLPYGIYRIQEVATNSRYLLTDGTIYQFSIRENGKIVTTADGIVKDNVLTPIVGDNTIVYKNFVIRGDLEFRKISNMDAERMNTLWTLTNTLTGEVHVIVADENGEYYSSAAHILHSTNTNANDSFLDRINHGETISMDEVNRNAGTWFGIGEDGTVAPVTDYYATDYIYNKKLAGVSGVGTDGNADTSGMGKGEYIGALPYGKYVLQEVRTDTNEGYTLQKITFYIDKQGRTVSLGTVEDYNTKIQTEALDGEMGLHVGPVNGLIVIEDEISYEGVTKGETYEVIGTLMDRDTGEVIATVAEDGTETPVTASSGQFTAPSAKGKVSIAFKVDSSLVKGRRVVCFETMVDKNGQTIAAEANLDNDDQTVYYPDLHTTLTYNGEHDVPSIGTITIHDTVAYTNLLPNKKYTLTGVLMDKETNDNVLDADGNEITASVEFVPESKDGTVDVAFTIDASLLKGHSIVAFETLSHRNTELVIHADINDEDQTVYFPEIGTTALDSVTGMHEALASESMVLVDTVEYKNVMIGKEYTLTGTLMNKDTKEPVLDKDGNPIVSVVKFTPTEHNGTIPVEFVFDASKMAGVQTVVFESLTRNDMEFASHADIEDEGQTVRFPEIQTTAYYGNTDLNEGKPVEKTVIVDKVSYKNLTVGETYTVKGQLMLVASGGPYMDADGKEIAAETTFTPETPDGTVDVTFEFNGTNLAGQTVVAFETLYHNDFTVAVHTDINDEGQSVHFPKLGTTLTTETGRHESLAAKTITVTDTVAYENLHVGKEYEMTGKLMDKATGEVMKDANGNEIVSVTKFTPEEPNGTVTLTFTVDSKLLAGKTMVAFEYCYRNDKEVAVHTDINDEDQSIHFPNMTTVAKRTGAEVGSDGYKDIYVSKSMDITDIINYENLIPGNVYIVEGQLMLKSSGEAIKDGNGEIYTSRTLFVPKEANGSTEVKFTLDTRKLGGEMVVMYERLYAVTGMADDSEMKDIPSYKELTADEMKAYKTELLVVDEDINNADETVTVVKPKLGTTAIGTVTGTHMLQLGDAVVIKDTIAYEGLNPNVTYKVHGVLMDKESGKPLAEVLGADASMFESDVELTPEQAKGTVEVTFTVNTNEILGRTLVVFETVSFEDEVVASHEDIESADQSVHVMSLSTVATANDGRAKEVDMSENTIIKDAVTYHNLIAGDTYYVTGQVVKSDGTPIMEPVALEFVPENPDGTVELTFAVDTRSLSGTTLVCFETVTDKNGNELGKEADVNNKDQSVIVKTKTRVQTGIETYAKRMALAALIVLGSVTAGIGAVMVAKKRKLAKAKKEKF